MWLFLLNCRSQENQVEPFFITWKSHWFPSQIHRLQASVCCFFPCVFSSVARAYGTGAFDLWKFLKHGVHLTLNLSTLGVNLLYQDESSLCFSGCENCEQEQGVPVHALEALVWDFQLNKRSRKCLFWTNSYPAGFMYKSEPDMELFYSKTITKTNPYYSLIHHIG